jgi:hypothetical protein
MNFEEMTLGQLLAVDTDSLSEDQMNAWLAAYEAKADEGNAQTPMDQWTRHVDDQGNIWLYDPASRQQKLIGKAQIVTDGGVKKWFDPETRQLTPIAGSEATPLSPSAQVTQEKLQQDPGTIIWSGNTPVGIVRPDRTTQSIGAEPEAQVDALMTSLQELTARRDELTRLSDPKFQTPGDEGSELAALKEQIAALDKEIQGKTSSLQLIAQKNKLNIGALGLSGGSSGGAGYQGKPLSQYVAEKQADFDYKVKEYEWMVATGQITSQEAKNQMAAWMKEFDDYLARARDAEAYNRDLPRLNAAEQRAQNADFRAEQAERRQGLKDKAALLKGQQETGMSMLEKGTSLGIAAPDVVARMAYDPIKAISQILQEMDAPQQAPAFTPLQPVEVPKAPTMPASMAPRPPQAGAPTAPLAPEY